MRMRGSPKLESDKVNMHDMGSPKHESHKTNMYEKSFNHEKVINPKRCLTKRR